MASKQAHGCPFPDKQAICSSEALQGIQRSIFRFNVKSMECMLVGKCSARPKRVIQAHCNEGFCSGFLIGEAIKSRFVGFQKENLRGMTHLLYGVSKGYLKWSCHAELRSHSSCQEATPCDPSVVYGSVLTCDRQCFTIENAKGLPASVACSTNVAVQTGIVADGGGMSDRSLFEMHQKPPVLSLGVCGNALIMRVGANGRCFHQQGVACGRGERMVLGARTEAKQYGCPLVDISGSCSDVSLQEPVSFFSGGTITPKFRADKLRGKTKQKKIGKASAPTRDLFERSFFHFFEVLFCHPFITMRAVPFNSQLPSQKSLRELVGITNQAAVGSAGVGVMFLLFVMSRMLCVNAALNKHVLARLAIGVGFLSLSLMMRRVSDVVICMVDDYSRSRRSKKESLINLRKELQHVVLNAIPLLVMCFIGAG